MNDFPPFIVQDYTVDCVENFVREFTGGDARADIFGKAQIQYLRQYFESGVKPATVVFETEYVDRTYLDDYTEYYATCFREHPRHCARIHFFSTEFVTAQFIEALTNGDSNERSLLVGESGDCEPYLGFIVIRPIPSTFFAKICLRPYRYSDDAPRKQLTKRYSASLFGIELSVSTIALLEQDKIVAVCATSALWTFFNASGHLVESRIPSPSSITKDAMQFDGEGARTFPNFGLTPTQILRTLGRQGLDVTFGRLTDRTTKAEVWKFFESLKANSYAHLSSDTPVLLGGLIYTLKEAPKAGEPTQATELGAHLVCVVGFQGEKEHEERYSAEAITKLYVHDDRYGAYVRLEVGAPLEIKTSDEKSMWGYLIRMKEGHGEVFVPDFFAIGHSHKIRIPYDTVKTICGILTNFAAALEEHVEDDPDFPIRQLLKSIAESVWDISIATNRALKADPENHKKDLFFNGANGARNLLLAPLPKYIWRCKLRIGHEVVFELLVDATEIPQGHTILGWISRLSAGELIRGFIANQYKLLANGRPGALLSLYEKKIGMESERLQKEVSSFDKFFREKAQKLDFDALFGPLSLPGRRLKTAEETVKKDVSPRSDIRILTLPIKATPSGMGLDQSKTYIWVIDREGNCRIAEDLKNPEQGHPTLVGGRAARVAGELELIQGVWTLSTKSGTYSWAINPDKELQKKYLSNVINYFFEAGSIEMQLLESPSDEGEAASDLPT